MPPLRLLIVEDRPADLKRMLAELRRADFQPKHRHAETREEFLEALDGPIDLVLADYAAPRFGAMQALEVLKQRGADIPIIVVTASLGDEAAVECIKQGAHDYVLKDRLGRLGPAVRRALEERRLRQEKLEAEEHYRRLAESNRRLLQEVNHRVRNNLANLRSLISLTRNKATDVQSFATALENRLMTLSQIHNLLAESGWEALDLRALVTSLIASVQRTAPHTIPIHVEGPPTSISPRQCLPLAMSLLELFTNSCKHGSHTRPNGHLSISWERLDLAEGPTTKLTWKETGGPAIRGRVLPSLGIELIEGFVSFELGGRCQLNFSPAGVEHVIEFPAASGGQDTPLRPVG